MVRLFLLERQRKIPSFELNNALLSRVRVYLLKSLTVAEIEQVLQQAISDPERGLGKERLVLEENLLQGFS